MSNIDGFYLVVHGQDRAYADQPFEYYSIISKHASLLEAGRARRVSGDLVYFNGNIVQDDSWLFDWEKEDDASYARKCQKANKKLSRRD